MTGNSVTIVVPALNEEVNLERAVAVMVEAADRWFEDYEILVFNDGSTDRTGQIAEELAAKYEKVFAFHHDRPKCVGGVCREGYKRARMEYAIYVDSKGATARESLDRIFSLKGKADLVIPYDTNARRRTVLRRIISRTFTGLLNLLFALRLRYYGTGALCKASLIRRLRIRTSSYAYNAEMLIKMLRSGCSYVEVGIEDRHDDEGRCTKAFRWNNIRGIAVFLARTLWDVYIARDYRVGAARRPADEQRCQRGNYRE